MLKVLHTADTHFSNKAPKLAEVITTTDFILERAQIERPDVAIIAGDLVDEHDGPIRFDSDTARAAIRFVSLLADICPVVIVRGTRSHDRETPSLFTQRRVVAGIHPIYVASMIEQVAFLPDNTFAPYSEDLPCFASDLKAVFTLIPSPDKSNLIATYGTASVASGNMVAKEALNDMMGFIGEVNSTVPENVPRILAAHGMITGAEFSSGSIATGEDFEYCLGDLALSNTDLKAFGHVHKFQTFPGNVFYPGSPGRLNMGETETKGFLIHSLEGRILESTEFIETPARRFALYEAVWGDDGIDAILAQASACESDCNGAEVRFRYSIPEELRHQINREELTARFMTAGARAVKIEPTLIPMVRQRAAGISQMDSLVDKVDKYGETSGIAIPERTRVIAATIRGRDVEELIEDARRAIAAAMATATTVIAEQPEAVVVIPSATVPAEQPPVAADQYHEADQFDLFA